MNPQELVLRFLASVGRPAEAQQYLELFRTSRQSEGASAFAVIHVSDPVLDHALDALAVDLRFLVELDLWPVVAFGAVSGRSAHKSAQRVAAALPEHVRATVTTAAAVPQALREDRLPLVALAPRAPRPEANEDEADRRFDALAELVAAQSARKLVFVGRRSGLQPRGGRVVSIIDVGEAESLAPTLPEPQAALLRQITRVLDAVPHPVTISVTSPLDLLRELFTVKGAGTLVRRGSKVESFVTWEALDRPRLIALVEEAFGKTLVPEFASRPFLRAYVAGDYRGAAIVKDTALAPYLSKFAVTTVARGEGVGRDLWRHLTGEHPRLFWRSRADNPITSWYREQCDGFQRLDIDGRPWVALWRGLAAAELPLAIHYCQTMPADFDG